eukprot:3863434-Pyramimonas_sp.AAC.1
MPKGPPRSPGPSSGSSSGYTPYTFGVDGQTALAKARAGGIVYEEHTHNVLASPVALTESEMNLGPQWAHHAFLTYSDAVAEWQTFYTTDNEHYWFHNYLTGE